MKLTITHNGTQVVIDQVQTGVANLDYENIIQIVKQTLNNINEQETENLALDALKLTEWEKHPSQQ
jgi:hypothetical protein